MVKFATCQGAIHDRMLVQSFDQVQSWSVRRIPRLFGGLSMILSTGFARKKLRSVEMSPHLVGCQRLEAGRVNVETSCLQGSTCVLWDQLLIEIRADRKFWYVSVTSVFDISRGEIKYTYHGE